MKYFSFVDVLLLHFFLMWLLNNRTDFTGIAIYKHLVVYFLWIFFSTKKWTLRSKIWVGSIIRCYFHLALNHSKFHTFRNMVNVVFRSMAGGQKVQIHPSSILFGKKPECIVFNELVQTNNNYVRNITRIDSMWLPELAPQYYSSQTWMFF